MWADAQAAIKPEPLLDYFCNLIFNFCKLHNIQLQCIHLFPLQQNTHACNLCMYVFFCEYRNDIASMPHLWPRHIRCAQYFAATVFFALSPHSIYFKLLKLICIPTHTAFSCFCVFSIQCAIQPTIQPFHVQCKNAILIFLASVFYIFIFLKIMFSAFQFIENAIALHCNLFAIINIDVACKRHFLWHKICLSTLYFTFPQFRFLLEKPKLESLRLCETSIRKTQILDGQIRIDW